jgi:hypothetical protein
MSGPSAAVLAAPRRSPYASREITLLDLLDRLLEGGIVVQGDVTLAVADVDLVALSLQIVVGAIDSLGPPQHAAPPKDG